jgi:hypothetical protein
MPEWLVRCGSKRETNSFDLPTCPAGEVCPNCKKALGTGHGKCFFSMKMIKVQTENKNFPKLLETSDPHGN